MHEIDIDHGAFRRTDLNLLVMFDALMETRSVSAAAALLFIGQPAASHALARLRELFQDPLFVRSGGGMSPTPRALALAGTVRDILGQAQAAIAAAPLFEPARAQGHLRLAMPDSLEALLLPDLLERLRQEAPGLEVQVLALPARRLTEALDQGEIDLAIAGVLPPLHEWHEHELLLEAEFDCVYAPAQLGLPDVLGLAELAQQRHLVTTYTAELGSRLEAVLEEAGLQRPVGAAVSGLLAIPPILKRLPYVSVLPSLLSSVLSQDPALRLVPLSIEGLRSPVLMLWHRRLSADPLQGYLRSRVREAVPGLLARLAERQERAATSRR